MKYSTSINLGLGTHNYVNVPGKYATRELAEIAANKFITKKHLPSKSIVMWVEG